MLCRLGYGRPVEYGVPGVRSGNGYPGADGGWEYAGKPAVNSARDGNCGPPEDGPELPRGREVGGRLLNLDVELWFGLVRVKGVTPALLAISCSPICQCMASAARHGMAISSAILAHISALNLQRDSQQCSRRTPVSPECGTTRSGATRMSKSNIPFVQPGELVLTVFVPFTPSLKIILVMEST